ncbi:sulfatase-like hydrolase/transferase [Kaistia sp. 32K]|uniref:sulfatase-like hydrolase/transferase n=1 Tax=Kaistia sp. 32K TaxID=2795690 RepID=UPI00191681CA|nr:sulfatase-like hydrolase/transferase [Kaistia sp. 32K]
MVLALASVLYRLRRRYLRSYHRRVRLRAEKLGWPLVVASLFCMWLGVTANLPSMLAQGLLVTLGAASLAVAVSIDLCCRRYLGAAPLTVWRQIPFASAGFSVPVLASTYLRAFLPADFVLATTVLFVATWALVSGLAGSAGASFWAASALFSTALLVWTLLEKLRARPDLPQEALAFLLHEPKISGGARSPDALYAADRSNGYSLDRSAPALPRTILLILNESAGHYLPSSEGDTSLAERILALSGRPDEWVAPGNVVTNSCCTEISFPSILTGAGAHESIETLHRLPFVFDLAKSRGYRTALLMSSVLKWLNLDRFFSAAPLDELYSAEMSGKPIINDLGIDDAFTVRRFEQMIEREDGPVFAVVFLNALHVPFQADSEFPLDAGLKDRRSRALAITERAHHRLFEALKRAGRYDDALIVSVGDHGELPGRQDLPRATIPRQENFSDWVLRPLFLLKPPRDLPAPMTEALHGNVDRLIANVDIAPTLAHLLGATLSGGLAYTGRSLFEPIPAERIAIATSANEWRPWHGAAVALARGRERLICDRYDFLQYESGGPVDPEAASLGRKELLEAAMQVATVRQNIAHIYREYH